MKIYLIFTLLCLSVICKGQNLSGSYRHKIGGGSGNRTITFSKNHFDEESNSDLTTSIGQGSYRIKNKQLVLTYEKVLNQDTSKFEINISDKPKGSSIIDLKILEKNGQSLVGMYGFRDIKNNPLSFSFTDKNGLGNITVYDNSAIGYFTIDCIGYHRISIPIKKIMGKIVSITAYLLPQTNYYVEPKLVTYKILEINNEKLILVNGKEKLVFEKIK